MDERHVVQTIAFEDEVVRYENPEGKPPFEVETASLTAARSVGL